MAKHAVEMTTSGSRGTEQGGRWAQEVAWAAGDGGWGGEEGAGQTLVHETHAPKRISHIQFGLLNAEVQEFRGGARERRRRRQLVVGVPSFQVSCCNNVLRFLAHVRSVVCFTRSRKRPCFDLFHRRPPHERFGGVSIVIFFSCLAWVYPLAQVARTAGLGRSIYIFINIAFFECGLWILACQMSCACRVPTQLITPACSSHVCPEILRT